MGHNDFLHDEFEEILYLKDMLRKCPMLSVMLIFAAVIVVTGLLRMNFAIFIILAIAGGFALPMIYGVRIGITPYESIIFALGIFMFLSYASLRILKSLESYSRAKPHLKALKRRSRPFYRFLNFYAGRLGILGIIALSTFIAGWWLAVVLAFIADIGITHAMTGIFIGLVAGGLLAWALYYGMEHFIVSPILIASIFLAGGLVVGIIMRMVIARVKIRRRRKTLPKRITA